jgi:lysophospholipase L1-like esterase
MDLGTAVSENMKIAMKHFVFLYWALSVLAPQSARAVEIMAFGDSITQGVWEIKYTPQGARVGGYEPPLEDLFSLVGRSATVYNWGLGGETTKQAREGIKWVCEVDPATGQKECESIRTRTIDSALASQGSANYMLLMEGTNDYFSGITPWATASNIGVMIDKAKAYGMVPIIGNITPDQRGLPKQIESRNWYIAITAAQKGVHVVDMYNGLINNWSEYVGSDNLHPNHAGYQAIARLWFMALYKLQLDITSVEVSQSTPLSAKAVFKGLASADGKVFNLGFEYGEDLSMRNSLTASPSAGDGTGGLSVTAEVKGLKFETTYYYRMISFFDGEKIYGATESFTTPRRIVTLTGVYLLLL